MLHINFGWRRSAEVFSHITAGIKAAHASNLDEASFIATSCRDEFAVAKPSTVHQPLLSALLRDKMPHFPKFGSAHVDDFAAVSILQEGRSGASAKDLLGAIKIYLGQDAIYVKKFKESTFWAQIQKSDRRMLGRGYSHSNHAKAKDTRSAEKKTHIP